MKSKSLILMVLSLGFGLVAAIGISQLMKANTANAQPVQEMAPVLLAADFLDLKDDLNEENVRLENWPKHIIPEGVATSLDDIKDMSTLERLSKGAPIFVDKLVHKTKKGGGVNIPEGFKVVSIKVSAEDHFAGLLNPGNKVDVIGLFKRRNKKDGSQQTLSRTFLKALQVFSINSRLTAAREDEQTNNNGTVIVGVLVTEKQAEEIFFVQRTGTIKLVMRGDHNDSDDDVEDLSDIMNMSDDDTLDGDQNEEQRAAARERELGQPSTMIVWIGKEPRKILITDGDVPQQMGTVDETSFVDAPRGPDDDLRGASDDSDDFDGSDENDRRTDEDQYRSE